MLGGLGWWCCCWLLGAVWIWMRGLRRLRHPRNAAAGLRGVAVDLLPVFAFVGSGTVGQARRRGVGFLQRDSRTAILGLQRTIAAERDGMASPIGAPAPLHLFGGERSLAFILFFMIEVEEVLGFLVAVGPRAPPSCGAFDFA